LIDVDLQPELNEHCDKTQIKRRTRRRTTQRCS